MPSAPPLVVYDCMIFVQAVASDRGPAFRCFELAEEHAVSLLVTAEILAEVRDVLGRTDLRRRFRNLTDERVEEFLDAVLGFAHMSTAPPAAFSLPRDPSDEPYLNLAIHADADRLITWNIRHLTYLMKGDTPEGHDFLQRFPRLRIMDPVTFLREIGA